MAMPMNIKAIPAVTDEKIEVCTTQNLEYPKVNSYMEVLQLSYTTSEPLNSSISGGKYLFKRTA